MPGQTNNTDLLTAVNQIIVVLNEINAQLPHLADKCCSCGYPSGLDPLPVEPPIEGTPPAGFATWQDYLNYKCKAANFVFDGIQEFFNQVNSYALLIINAGIVAGTIAVPILVETFKRWRTEAQAATGPLTGTLLVGFFLIYFSEAQLLILAIAIVAIISIAGLIGGTIYFNVIASQMENSRTDIVCALYNAGTVAEAQIIIDDLLEPIVANVATTFAPNPYSPVAWLFSRNVTQIITYLTLNANINKLFEKDDSFLTYTGMVDCAGCSDCPAFTVDWGDIIGQSQNQVVVQAEPTNGQYYAEVIFNMSAWFDPCGNMVSITSVSVSPPLTVPPGSTGMWRLYGQDGSTVYSSNTEPSWPQTCYGITVVSHTAFDFTVNW